MKKLGIYFSDPEPMGAPFNSTYTPYWEIYQEIICDIEKQGISAYIFRGVESYIGGGLFSHGWQIKDGALVAVNENIKVDLIFHRGNHSTILPVYDCPTINHPELERLCDDKVKIAELFSDFSPKTKAVNSYQEFENTAEEWQIKQDNKIVLKKNFLSQGQGVYVLPVKEVTESLYGNWENILVQEFVDSSIGIPGVVRGFHDIRIISINCEPVYALLRTPPAGSFIANVARGGTPSAVPLDKLPPALLGLVSIINSKFTDYKPSILGADFFNSKDGFKLIEINCPPGVRNPKFSSQDKILHDKMVQMLVDALN